MPQWHVVRHDPLVGAVTRYPAPILCRSVFLVVLGGVGSRPVVGRGATSVLAGALLLILVRRAAPVSPGSPVWLSVWLGVGIVIRVYRGGRVTCAPAAIPFSSGGMAKRPRRAVGARAAGTLPTLDLDEVERAVTALRYATSGTTPSSTCTAVSSSSSALLASASSSSCRATSSSLTAASLSSCRATSPSLTATSLCRASSSSVTAQSSPPAPATPRMPRRSAIPSLTAPATPGAAAPSTPGGGRVFPAVRPRVRGSAADLSELGVEALGELLRSYEADKVAATSTGSRAALLNTWSKFLSTWRGEVMPTVPVEPADIAHVGSIMKGLGYRSFANYVSAMKQEHIRAGFAWTDQHELEARQGNRSVTRGQGPPRQSAPLILEDVVALPLGPEPIAFNGPVNPGGAVFIGSAFLMREIELAYARLAHLHINEAKKRVTLELPVSKTDPTAVGCSRMWGCTCQCTAIAGDCVYHAAVAHKAIVLEVLGIADGAVLAQALPLFPNSAGETVSKAAVVATIEAVAARLGESLTDGAGSRRFGGHSMRVSGAQWLGLLGFSVEHVKTFGRWASDTVVRYLGDSHISDLARARNRFVRERGLLDSSELPVAISSGPKAAAEIERLVQQAVDQRMEYIGPRLDALSALAVRYDTVLHEGRRIAHALDSDLAAPSLHWQTRCGWHFAATPGWRLSCALPAEGWRQCAKCFA